MMRGVIPILALLVAQSWYHPTCIPPQSTSPMGDSSPAPLQHPSRPPGPPRGQGSSVHILGQWPGHCIPHCPAPTHWVSASPGRALQLPKSAPRPAGCSWPPKTILWPPKGMLQPPQGCSQPPPQDSAPGPGCVVPHVLSRRRRRRAVAARGPPFTVPASRHRSGIG